MFKKGRFLYLLVILTAILILSSLSALCEEIVLVDVIGREVVLEKPATKVVGTHNPTLNAAVVLGGGEKYIAGFGNKEMSRGLYEAVMDEFKVSPDEIRLFYGEGCSHCKHTGYKGRTAVFELMVINEPIRELIYKHATISNIRDAAIKENGMISLKEDGLLKISEGITTMEEVVRATSS
jgi:hypothetical protein